MTIVNLGSKLDKFQEYLKNNTTLNNLFDGGISAGKPLENTTGMTLFFSIDTNSTLVSSSRENGKNLKKRALVEFVIISNNKSIADVEMYETLDTLTNEIVEKEINLDGFIIHTIFEQNQSGVIKDTNENPVIIAQYYFDYKSKY